MKALIAVLMILPALGAQEPAGAPPAAKTVRLEAAGGDIVAVLVPNSGGRIIGFGRGGDNILFDNPDYAGRTLENSKPEAIAQGYTGYNLDLGPERRGIPRHLALWMGKYAVSERPRGIRLESAHDPAVGMTLIKDVWLDPQSGTLDLQQTMKNSSDQERTYCLWDRTLCRGGGYALVPLRAKSRLASGWSVLKDGTYVAGEHPGVKVLDGVLVAKAEGRSSKLGADPDAGWIAYARGRQLLVKYYPVAADGKYSDGGNTVELYFDPKVCELEPLSPEVALRPGETSTFPERWILIPLEREPASHEEARELVKKIPENPFHKK